MKVELKDHISNNRNDKPTSMSIRMDSLIPPSKISNLTQGIFVGAVSDNFDERIKQKIFHCKIVMDNVAIDTETKAYKKVSEIINFTNADGNDTMQTEIDLNKQIKQDVNQYHKSRNSTSFKLMGIYLIR
jgi:hypothetical protein